MKKLFPFFLITVIFLSSCGSPFATTVKGDDYKIGILNGWKRVTTGDAANYEVFISPEETGTSANLKIQSQTDAKITWGRIDEVTTDYAQKAVDELGYTLISDKYQFVPQAQREQRYELVFSAEYNGQAFTVIQHLYARNIKAIFVTGTYPENDFILGDQVKEMMDSFLLAPKNGWED